MCHRQSGCAGREDQTRYWSCAFACCSAARRCAFSKDFASFSSGVVPRLSGMVGDYARRPFGAHRTHSSWSGERLPLLTPPCRGLATSPRKTRRSSERNLPRRARPTEERCAVPPSAPTAPLPVVRSPYSRRCAADSKPARCCCLAEPQRKGAHWLVRPGDKQRQHASERYTLPQVGDRSLVRPPLEPGARCWDGSPLLVSVARGVSTTLERRKAQDDEARDSEFGSGDMEHSVRTLLAAPRRRRWFTPGDVYVPEVPAKP